MVKIKEKSAFTSFRSTGGRTSELMVRDYHAEWTCLCLSEMLTEILKTGSIRKIGRRQVIIMCMDEDLERFKRRCNRVDLGIKN